VRGTLKGLIIIGVFLASMIALLYVKGLSPSGKRTHRMVFIETRDDWKKCDLMNVYLDKESQSAIFKAGRERSHLTSYIIDPGFPFMTALLSWNAERLPEGSLLNFQVEVSKDKEKWNRFQYLFYGTADPIAMAPNSESPTEIEGVGFVDTDVLKLYEPMRYARVLVDAFPSDDSTEIILRRLSLCLSSGELTMKEYGRLGEKEVESDIGKVKLAVPYLTQRGMPEGLSGNCCSPTSVTMVLNHYNKNVDLIPFCYEVYDPYHDMYGDWPYNVQAAYLAGMARTWVEIHDSFDDIYGEVSDGRPVVISIAYGYDELPNSPIHSAEVGHLIVVAGFDGPDTVICNDPAGHDATDGIIRYPRKELEQVWVDHGGVAYHLWPDW
jgi:uncharacterized protein YvpB